ENGAPVKDESGKKSLKRLVPGAFWRCVNPECPAQFRQRLEYFASKEAMNINGVGSEMVVKLTQPIVTDSLFGESEPPLVQKFSDLYDLTAERLLKLPGVKEQSASNLLKSIAESKKRGAARLLAALSIDGIGVQTAKDIIAEYATIDALAAVERREEFAERVNNIGGILAKNLYDFFHSEHGRRIVAELKERGLDMGAPKSAEETAARGNLPLRGMTICVTGTLSGYDRVGVKAAIERFGGKATSAPSKKTSYLLTGANPGDEKIKKAAELGIPLLTEEEFQALVGGDNL
ncbi:MAG: hypothetical protein HUK22_06715, partial [Thermoguttaceae bacterium]|nr:hypothetical protein [Thermoguttaceae bacterium]